MQASLALVFCVVATTSHAALSDNLIAYYSLDDATDAHTNSYDLTNNNTVTFTAGKVGNAATFSAASSQYLSHADNADFSMGDVDFTVAAWIKTSATGTVAGMVGKFTTATNDREYILRRRFGEPRFVVSSAGNVESASADRGSDISTGTWYFVVGVHDAANDEIILYVDNETPVTTAYSSGVFDGVAAFTIGARATPSNYFDGQIDEVAVWKRALSPSEIAELYNSGSGRDYAYVTSSGTAATIFTQQNR